MLLELDLERIHGGAVKSLEKQRDREMHYLVDGEMLAVRKVFDGLMNVARHMGGQRTGAAPVGPLLRMGTVAF